MQPHQLEPKTAVLERVRRIRLPPEALLRISNKGFPYFAISLIHWKRGGGGSPDKNLFILENGAETEQNCETQQQITNQGKMCLSQLAILSSRQASRCENGTVAADAVLTVQVVVALACLLKQEAGGALSHK